MATYEIFYSGTFPPNANVRNGSIRISDHQEENADQPISTLLTDAVAQSIRDAFDAQPGFLPSAESLIFKRNNFESTNL